jgi:hypothetical protein
MVSLPDTLNGLQPLHQMFDGQIQLAEDPGNEFLMTL